MKSRAAGDTLIRWQSGRILDGRTNKNESAYAGTGDLMRCKILLFDLDHALLDFGAQETDSLTRMFRQFGYAYPDELFRHYHTVNKLKYGYERRSTGGHRYLLDQPEPGGAIRPAGDTGHVHALEPNRAVGHLRGAGSSSVKVARLQRSAISGHEEDRANVARSSALYCRLLGANGSSVWPEGDRIACSAPASSFAASLRRSSGRRRPRRLGP